MDQQLSIMQAEQANQVPVQSAFSDSVSFEHAQRVAKMLSSSDLVPQIYKGNVQNTMIALEMANRGGASPLMVMQNLNIIQGKPSWGSSFIIASINSCGKFTAELDFEVTGKGEDLACIAYTFNKAGKRVESPQVTMKMAVAEGWVSKPGSKWKTMPELMIRYRAAAFFGRLHCPELLMGMQTTEEIVDVAAPVMTMEEKQEAQKNRVANLKTATDGK